MATKDDEPPAKPESKTRQQIVEWFSVTNPDMWISIGVVVIVLVVGWFFGNQIFNLMIDAKAWFISDLPVSLVLYYIVFVISAMCLIPYGPFCIAMGFIYGFFWGFLIQMVGVFVSSAVLYGVGRTILKEKVHEIISRSEGSSVWKGLLKFINKDWREAAKINVLLCFMPVPYGSHPYLFSLSDVPFEQFVLFFMMGMVPNTILNLLIGVALSDASEPGGLNQYHIIGTVMGIVAMVLVVWYASHVAQEILDDADKEEEAKTEGDKLIP
ncbi:hypothetical protein T484DRAFT_1926716 [Baffinella frigidus]|nr:hypothetical protein T484DRAFT_1926716 [Cryptophyta sp. CCMP2293]|mmetsp:Transcript_61932/g.147520  ORF Transcript_61932/g.147520 Transcript_61932/m.147520 type:complete len:269 (-) Transcript_61932:72-878(-)